MKKRNTQIDYHNQSNRSSPHVEPLVSLSRSHMPSVAAPDSIGLFTWSILNFENQFSISFLITTLLAHNLTFMLFVSTNCSLISLRLHTLHGFTSHLRDQFRKNWIFLLPIQVQISYRKSTLAWKTYNLIS